MRRPNILLLYSDQQRWDALGAAGNAEIHTPNLDRLAQHGVSFDHCFVQNPVCMPSRVSFLTGQYPSTLRITAMGVPVPPETPTLPRLLKPYGYRTANIGKLHFLPHANRDHRVPHPDYGFDHLEIADEPGVYEDAYRAWVRAQQPEGPTSLHARPELDRISVGLPPATAVWYETMGITDTVAHPGMGGRDDFSGAIPFPAAENLTHSAFVADQTIAFLAQQQPDRPFLCISGFYSPHAPWVVPRRFLELYDPSKLPLPRYGDGSVRPAEGPGSDAQLRSARHGYYAMVSEIDHYVGQILDQLAARGLERDTIVVFTSDHGEWLGDHGRFGKGYPGDDAVSRVPLIIRAPRAAATAGTLVQSVVEAVDVLPTLLELAGIQVPPHVQGHSLAPVLRGVPVAEPGAALMEHSGWKTLRTSRYRYLVHQDGREALWDIERDPGEQHDVAGEPAYTAALAEHRRLLLRRLIESERPLPRLWPY